ncbi:unnamed protein product, partial [Choristocarpus tenellus]
MPNKSKPERTAQPSILSFFKKGVDLPTPPHRNSISNPRCPKNTPEPSLRAVPTIASRTPLRGNQPPKKRRRTRGDSAVEGNEVSAVEGIGVSKVGGSGGEVKSAAPPTSSVKRRLQQSTKTSPFNDEISPRGQENGASDNENVEQSPAAMLEVAAEECAGFTREDGSAQRTRSSTISVGGPREVGTQQCGEMGGDRMMPPSQMVLNGIDNMVSAKEVKQKLCVGRANSKGVVRETKEKDRFAIVDQGGKGSSTNTNENRKNGTAATVDVEGVTDETIDGGKSESA